MLHIIQHNAIETIPARYSKGPLFRKSIVQIRTTVLRFGLRLGLRLCLELRLGLELGLGLGLVEIVNFWNSGPLE